MSITDTKHNNALRVAMLNMEHYLIDMLCDITLTVFILGVVTLACVLNVVMLCVIIMNVIMLSVGAPSF
jgi:hypothetical protein